MTASRTFQGGYAGTFTGTLMSNPACPTHGFNGTFDFGGTQSDVLLGTYSHQTGDSGPLFDWTTVYFSSFSNFAYNRGWTYHYQSQTWNNFYYGSSGDIVT